MMNDESVNQEFNEGQVIRYYFTRGFSYYGILLLLEKQHRHVISYSKLLRRLNELGLHRRQKNADHTPFRRQYQRIRNSQRARLQRWISSSLAYTKYGRNSGSAKVFSVVFERNRFDWMRATSETWY